MFSYIKLPATIGALFVVSLLNAQLTERQLYKIDSLVTSWNAPESPGGVIGIIQNEQILYTSPFGMASLDYDIPVTDNTLFNIGSISKQFTALGIIKLSLEGKLSIDDDISKYFPELPDFGHTITIRHLMHHTSGLRDIHSILMLAGWRAEDPRSDDDLFRIMKDQKELNFVPGDEYMYSNTGYIFMAKIIEQVSGEKFDDWMKENIFTPLGLSKTYIENDATKVVKGNATSYHKMKDNSFARAVEYWNYDGSGNIHTTIYDLLTWLNNFTCPPPDWKEAFDLLQTRDTLNNGKMINYAFGIEIGNYKGQRRIQHGGSVGGFRSYACSYTEKNISLAILTNYSSSLPQEKINSLSDIIFPQNGITPEAPSAKKEEFTFITNDNLGKYIADYWLEGDNISRKVQVRNDTLCYCRPRGIDSPLGYIGNDEFVMLNTSNQLKVKFLFNGDTLTSMLVSAGDSRSNFRPYTPVTSSVEYLSQFTGKFNSVELNTYYTFFVRNGILIVHHPKHGYFMLEILKQDLFRSDGPLQTISYIRDEKGEIKGMRVSHDRVKNLWLEKQ